MAELMSSVLGHEGVKKALAQAIQVDRVPSTYLFSGLSGIGKSKVALAFAQSLICSQKEFDTGLACGVCADCVRVETNNSQSLLWIEPDGKAIKVEQAREIIRWCSLQSPSQHRVVVLDDAHTLNPQAGNALLKVLEEPPRGTHFILITSNLNQMLVTLRSRSQVERFSPLTSQQVMELTGCEPWVAESSRGSVKIADMLRDHADVREHSLSCLRSLLNGPARTSFLSLKEVVKSKEETQVCLGFWQQFFRDVEFDQSGLDELIHRDQKPLIEEYAQRISGSEWVGKVSVLERDIYANGDRSLGLENFVYQLKSNMA